MSKKLEKYLFNLNNFDDGPISTEPEPVIEEQPKEESPPPPPTFSEEELEQAKQLAHDQGFQEGTQRANDANDALKQKTLEQIAQHIPSLFALEQDRIKQYEHDALRLCQAILNKIAPTLSQAHLQNTLAENIQNIIASNTNAENIIVQVNPSVTDKISNELKSANHNDKITVSANETIPAGSCNIEWPAGGGRYSFEQTIQEIEQIISQIMQANNIPELEISKENEKLAPNNTIQDSPAPQEYDTINDDETENTSQEDNIDGDNP